MSRSINEVRLLGNLGKHPELRYWKGVPPTAYCDVSIATHEEWVDTKTGEIKKATEWHNLQIVGSQAELFAETFSAGDGVLICGKQKTRSWTPEGEQKKRYKTYVEVSAFWPAGFKKDSAESIPPEGGE